MADPKDTEDKKKKDGGEEKPKPEPPPDRESSTEGSVTIGGRRIPYKALAGSFTMKTDEGDAKSTMFYVAYMRSDVADTSSRPIMFTFNGGPGSSSVWLHMGFVGPRRVDVLDWTEPQPAPYRIVDNEFSLLDVTDLVFIDPVSTGYSRSVKGEDPKQFHGVKEDLESVGDFIRLFTSRMKRWTSPKFVMGESYGTTRAAGLSNHLMDRHGMYLNGVMLVSAVLYFQTLTPMPGNDLPFALYLPSYATTAAYHGKTRSKNLDRVIDSAVDFALGDYISALLRGTSLTSKQRSVIAKRMSELTGLDQDFVERTDLRVSPRRFFKELLRDRGRTVGRFDSRIMGQDRDSAGEGAEYDPSFTVVQGPFYASINHYVRADLNFESDLVYEALSSKVSPWKYGESAENRYLDTASSLRAAMSKNPSMKVFLASGVYDLATAFAAAEWTMDNLGLEPRLRSNITTARYEAGHMMYTHTPSIRKLRDEVAAFIRSSSPSSEDSARRPRARRSR